MGTNKKIYEGIQEFRNNHLDVYKINVSNIKVV